MVDKPAPAETVDREFVLMSPEWAFERMRSVQSWQPEGDAERARRYRLVSHDGCLIMDDYEMIRHDDP